MAFVASRSLPPVEQRTVRAAYGRALAEVPDELAQLDRTLRRDGR